LQRFVLDTFGGRRIAAPVNGMNNKDEIKKVQNPWAFDKAARSTVLGMGYGFLFEK
jgi:hypothetical protein